LIRGEASCNSSPPLRSFHLLFPRTTTTLQLSIVLGGTSRQCCPVQPMSVYALQIFHTFIGHRYPNVYIKDTHQGTTGLVHNVFAPYTRRNFPRRMEDFHSSYLNSLIPIWTQTMGFLKARTKGKAHRQDFQEIADQGHRQNGYRRTAPHERSGL
jgi:hypothetical protein